MKTDVITKKDMLSDYRCFFCFIKSFSRLIERDLTSVEEKNSFTAEMASLYLEYKDNLVAPVFVAKLHEALFKYTGNADPYKQVKRESNDLVLSLYQGYKLKVLDSENPFDLALRLAIAGNIIDFAVKEEYDLEGTINNVLSADFAINHSDQLRQALKDADTVLYLGDNCGEIVFDKLLVETIDHPDLYFAVRGAPIINDATYEDALYVGVDKVAKLISNGNNAPSTIVNACSLEFQEIWEKADVVIAKGQGNLEGLWAEKQKKIFNLLMVKCDLIAESLKVNLNDFVIRCNQNN